MSNEEAVYILKNMAFLDVERDHEKTEEAIITAISALESIDRITAERDAAIKDEALLEAYDAEHKGPAGRARTLIEEAPTVDAVKVVRCRDCVNYHNSGEAEGIGWCDVHSRIDALGEWDIFEPDDFCSYGERKAE